MGLHVDRGDGMAPGPSEFRSSVEGVAAIGVFKKKNILENERFLAHLQILP